MTGPEERHPDDSADPAGESAPRPGGAEGHDEPTVAVPEEGAATEGGSPSEDTADPFGDELVTTQMALAELTTDLQRLQAEFVNYKRRVERDRELVKQNATFAALATLMPVLDDVDRAREHGEVEGGFKAVADALDRAVNGLGLTKFGVTGDEFDPTLHEALMHGHSPEVTTTTVDKVVQAGYRIGERVVRAAKVTVLDPED